MAVRFLPLGGGEPDEEPPRDRENLAEVIDLRSRLNETTGAWVSAPGEAIEPSASARTLRAAGSPKGPLGSNVSVVSFGSSRRDSAGSGETDEATQGSASALHVQEEPEVRTASEDAVRLLARRARSSGELRRELAALGHASNDVEEVVLECESSLYLDDLGLARVLTEGLRARKKASRAQIRVKLRERLLPDGVVEEVLAELDDEEEDELLREAARERARKMQGLDRQTAERRLLGFLARRGWSGERAVRVAREALDATAARGTVRFR